MGFMIRMTVEDDSEASVMPRERLLAEMRKYSDESVRVGVLFTVEGLDARSQRPLINFAVTTVLDGPFPETKQ
jgi:hypothetical protein